MRIKTLLILITFYAFTKALPAQTHPYTIEDVVGTYTKKHNDSLEKLNYGTVTKLHRSLTLFPDGRFEYHNFRKLQDQEDENWYARGTWTLNGKIISFSNTEKDLSMPNTIDLNNTKARFFKKSPRNKSLKKQPTYIQFYQSENRIIKRLKLFKTNE